MSRSPTVPFLTGLTCVAWILAIGTLPAAGPPEILDGVTIPDDLQALAKAGRGRGSKVVVSFPLRVSPLVATVKEVLAAGKIGAIEAVTAWCDPPYADVYYSRWYRDEAETGGLWLQKATHDLDYRNYLIGLHPAKVFAMESRRVWSHSVGHCDCRIELPHAISTGRT